MKLRIKIIDEKGIYFSSENIPKEIKKSIPDDLEISSTMAKGILSMETEKFTKFLYTGFLPNEIKDKNEEVKYYFEILPEHQNFVAKISDQSYILFFDNNTLSKLQENISAERENRSWPIQTPRIYFYTENGGIVRVNTQKDSGGNFDFTEVVFTLRDVKIILKEN